MGTAMQMQQKTPAKASQGMVSLWGSPQRFSFDWLSSTVALSRTGGLFMSMRSDVRMAR